VDYCFIYGPTPKLATPPSPVKRSHTTSHLDDSGGCACSCNECQSPAGNCLCTACSCPKPRPVPGARLTTTPYPGNGVYARAYAVPAHMLTPVYQQEETADCT